MAQVPDFGTAAELQKETSSKKGLRDVESRKVAQDTLTSAAQAQALKYSARKDAELGNLAGFQQKESWARKDLYQSQSTAQDLANIGAKNVGDLQSTKAGRFNQQLQQFLTTAQQVRSLAPSRR